ncbi:MAG: DUF503 domain-containing protein [Peptostreptococcaceae bacterium]
MRVIVLKITLRANWVHSLKEKRMVVKSITAKLKNKFNISVSEIDKQDVHQSIVIGVSGVCLDNKQADSIIENIIRFTEENSEGEIINIEEIVEVY